jgi:formate C-acetyltransferase
LTELFLERVVPRFENPVVVFRYTPETPESVSLLVCEKMRANASVMVYNDENVIPAMVHAGIAEGDAITYTMHGCNWPDVPGIERRFCHCAAELPRYVLDTLGDADSRLESIDDVYEGVAARFRKEIERACDRLREERRRWDELSPGPLRADDCFLDGPIAQARSWQFGGLKYDQVTCPVWSLATASDSLAALDELVFQSKAVPLDALKEALRADFAGCEHLRKRCLNAPKFGRDDSRADGHAVRLLDMVLQETDRASRLDSDDPVIVFRCLETDMAHIRFGKGLGATPDGRRAGQPTSENTSPYPGSATKGITGLLRSVAKLPLRRVHSGALNVRLQPRLSAGEEGLARLANLLRTYFDMGGLQVQLSFADVQELRDAQANPERHRDLMVRITGYSAAFVDMSAAAQEEIIRREEMGH